MTKPSERIAGFRTAWFAMAAAVGLHVLDEAWNNFLVVYNPAAMSLMDSAPWLRLPVFRYQDWLAGLLAFVLLLFALTPAATRAPAPMRWAARALAVLMTLNALAHIAFTITGRTVGGIVFTRPMPGFWSSPLLLLCSIWLWKAARRPSFDPPSPAPR